MDMGGLLAFKSLGGFGSLGFEFLFRHKLRLLFTNWLGLRKFSRVEGCWRLPGDGVGLWVWKFLDRIKVYAWNALQGCVFGEAFMASTCVLQAFQKNLAPQ